MFTYVHPVENDFSMKHLQQLANEDSMRYSQTSSEPSQNVQNEPFIPEDRFKHSSTQTDTTIENENIL